MRLTTAALAILMAALLLLALPNATTAGEGDDQSDVTFDKVEITPDPLIIGEILVVEATISTDLTIDGVEMYYCIDDMCKLPKPMTDEGDGKYSYKIYPEEEGSDEHEFYLTSGQDEAWVKIKVITGNSSTYWPPKTHERYSEGYFKVPVTVGGTDGVDGEDGKDNDKDDGDSPGFEAAVFIGAFVAVTAVALASRRRRK